MSLRIIQILIINMKLTCEIHVCTSYQPSLRSALYVTDRFFFFPLVRQLRYDVNRTRRKENFQNLAGHTVQYGLQN